MSTFEDYLKSRQEQFNKTSDAFSQDGKKEYDDKDERLWYPAGDKTESGSAVIRFLPPKLDSKSPFAFVKLWHHGFKGPNGSWYIENCQTTLGRDHLCPVCEGNRELWNSGKESDKDIARERKRKLSYYSNIYVINDSTNPDNNGKVMIYRYGMFIYKMLNEKMHPSFEDQERVNPFDLLEGCTLRMRYKKDQGSGFRTYAASEWDPKAPLFDDNDKMAEVYNSMYDLHEFVDPETQFKGFDETKARYDRVVGNVNTKPRPTPREEEVETEASTDAPWEGESEIEETNTEEFDEFFENLEKD